MLLSPLVPRTFWGVTVFLFFLSFLLKSSRRCNVTVTTGPEDIRGCNWIPGWRSVVHWGVKPSVSGTIISPWFLPFSGPFFSSYYNTRQKKEGPASIMIKRSVTWFFESLYILSHLLTTPAQHSNWQKCSKVFAPSSQFFHLCPWLLVALGRFGFGLVAALL